MSLDRHEVVYHTRVMDSADPFDTYRSYLFGIAYRMLGTIMDAEDVLQEAFLRWQMVDRSTVQAPRAYLTAMVTRLSIDQLKSAREQREQYIGPWLPEPLMHDPTPGADDLMGLSESISMAFLVLLEKLTPVERAAFLLHDVFGYSYPELAAILERNEAACRQLVHRARTHVQANRPRFPSRPERARELASEFGDACRTGDLNALMSLLTEDITLWSDGGGRVSAARRPVFGADRVARFLIGVLRQAPPEFEFRQAESNGGPAFLALYQGAVVFVLSLEMGEQTIHGIRIVVNPDKLQRMTPSRTG
jgi:RNA polymerase sigma-70 factor, ECF subfamily